ncbi:MAG TPA: ferric reductase-like transmembrane domain-containing protein [Bryobacteraceae bacterium]|jgi:predicted ferric reductase|nr:ferric reductase-like transmembrane domain-containing protein [Bryobacteraceae bacterium]
MTAVDLSSYAGLTAMILLTVNILLGLILSTRYNPPRRWWPYGRRRVFDIHNWTAYIALGLVVLHPVLLLFSATAKFHVPDIILPLNSPGQRLYNCFGAAAFYLVCFVVTTSYLRKRMTFRFWKAFHYVAYAAGAMLFLHGIIIDPNLKKQSPDLLDGEKVLIEICALLVITGSLVRIRYGAKIKRPAALKMEFDDTV